MPHAYGKENTMESNYMKHPEHSVYIQELHKLVVLKDRNFDPWEITKEIDELYDSVKIVGIDKTIAWLKDDKGREICIPGRALPERMRALAVQIIIQRKRQDDGDISTRRLGEHFGLDKSIRLILGDTKIFEDNTCSRSDLPIISLNDTYERFLEKA